MALKNKGARRAQKLGSRYPVKATLITIVSLFTWLLWILLFPGLNYRASVYSELGFDSDWIKVTTVTLGFWSAFVSVFLLGFSPFLRVKTKRFLSNIQGLLSIAWFQMTARVEVVFDDDKDEPVDGKAFFSMMTALVLGVAFFIVLGSFFVGPVTLVIYGIISTCFDLYHMFTFLGKGLEMTQSQLWFAFAAGIPFVKYVLGSWFILYVPFSLYKALHGLGETNLLRRFVVLGKGASSRWAGPKTYKKIPSRWKEGRIYIGSTDFHDVGPEYGRPVMLEDDGHVITIGCPGSGKSTTVIFPNLAHYQGNCIVFDPKGEHCAATFWRRNSPAETITQAKTTKRSLGKGSKPVCFKLDPFKEVPHIPSAHYNPLSDVDIDDIYNNRTRLEAIADACVLDEGPRNRYFTGSAKKVIAGTIAHVLSTRPKEDHNLPFIHDLLMGFDPKIGYTNLDHFDQLLVEMKGNTVAGGKAAEAAALLENREASGFTSIMQTVRNSIGWMGDEAMREHLTSGSDFSFMDFRERVPGTKGYRTLYIVAPIGAKLEEQMRWLRVLTNLGIEVMRSRGEDFEGHTLFVLDEFAQLGSSLSAITQGLVTLRSLKIKLWTFLQNYGQLEKRYPDNLQDFMDTSSIQVFGVESADRDSTAEWLSKRLGSYYNQQDFEGADSRRLLTPQEASEDYGKNNSTQIFFHHGIAFPMRLRRRAYVRLKQKGHLFKRIANMRGCFERKRK